MAGEQRYALNLGTFGVRSLVGDAIFTPDGTKVASLLLGTLTVWDVVTGKNLYRIDASTGLIAFTVSSDGTKIACNAGKGENALVYHMDVTGEQLELELEGNKVGECFAFSSEGKRVVSGSRNGEVWVWDAVTGETLLSWEGHTDLVRDVAFSPDGSKIVTASNDKTARLWDALTGTPLHIFEGHTDSIADVGFSPHGEKIITGSCDNTLRVWDALNGKELHTYRGHNHQVISVKFSSDGTKIVSAGANCMICTWDAEWEEEEVKYLSLPGQTQIPPELPDPPAARKCLRDRFAVFKWLHRSGGEGQESASAATQLDLNGKLPVS